MSNKHCRACFVFLVAVVTLLIVACGGGEEATPTAQTTGAAQATPRPVVAPAPTATARPLPPATLAPQPTATIPPQSVATPSPQPAVEPKGTLKVAIATFSQEGFDPAKVTSGFQEIATEFFDWMIWHSPEGELAPGVLTRWEMAQDGKSWTFTNRPMQWSDGSPVTAEDIKFSLERSVHPQAIYSGATGWRKLVDRAEVVSPNQIRLFTSTTGPLVHFSLAPRSRQFSGVVMSKAAFDRLGEKAYFEAPLGSGPWKLLRHDQGQRIIYAASPIKHPFRATPGFAQLELLSIPEESTRVAMLRTGQAHLAEISSGTVSSLRNAGLQILEIPSTLIASVMLPGRNNPTLWAQAPVRHQKVREALALAIDRQEIVGTIMDGFAKVAARHAIEPSAEGWDPAWQPDPFDPKTARQLLSEAGYPNGMELKVYSFPYLGAAWFVPVMNAIAGYWANIGVDVKIIPSDQGSVSRLHGQRPQGPNVVGWAYLLPSFTRQQPLSGLEAIYGSGSAVNLLPAPEVMDDLLFRAQTTVDQNERIRLTRQIVNLAHAERLAIPIVMSGALYGAGKELGGWKPIQGLSMIGTILESLRPNR
ncbi:MAG: hypothetical protein HYX90_00660 [Chloroflexi bacterium]|nr:hypothetical protein [Chloroflexota bacterium]